MKYRNKVLIFIFIIYPYIVGFTPEASDSVSTVVKIIVGRGSYADVSRDCEGNPISVVEIPFTEAAGGIEHQRGKLHTVVEGGVIKSKDGTVRQAGRYWSDQQDYPGKNLYYVSPRVGILTSTFGMNLGLIIFSDYYLLHDETGEKRNTLPSFSIRYGNLNNIYVSTGYLSSFPLISGGTYFDLGVGFYGKYPVQNFWIGIGSSPYDSFTIILKADLYLSRNIILLPRGLLGIGSASHEYGLSIGAAVRF